MKVKFFTVVLVTFVISLISFLIYSCGDESKVDCTKVCNKEKECGEIKTDEDLNTCITNCKKYMNAYFQSSFIDQMNKCYDKECSEIDNCLNYDASKQCKAPDYKPAVESICDKEVECKKTTSREECVSNEEKGMEMARGLFPILNCYTDSYYKDFGECIKSNVSCENYDNDMKNCQDHPK